MRAQILLAISLLCLICLALSCERIPPPDPAFDLTEAKLTNQTSIPLEYGKLVSVTSAKPGIAHLWFEDTGNTIRMVQVNYGKGIVPKNVWIIDRN